MDKLKAMEILKRKGQDQFVSSIPKEACMLLDKLSFGGSSILTEVWPTDEATPIVEKLIAAPDNMKIWYRNQSVLLHAIEADKKNKIFDYLINIHNESKDDKQFPPDPIKSQRLYGLLEIIKPSHILELGCGTSTHIIQLYKTNSNSSTRILTVDNDLTWINLTKDKLANNLQQDQEDNFMHHKNDKETTDELNKYAAESEKLFIYLDAKVLDNESRQGLDLIIKFSQSIKNSFYILIDCRILAFSGLYLLSQVTGRRLQLMTNIQRRTNDERVKGVVEANSGRKIGMEERRINVSAGNLNISPGFYTLVKIC